MFENIKTVHDLRAILAEEINKIRNNKTTAVNLNALSNAVGKILSSLRIQLEYSKLINKKPDISFINLIDVEEVKKLE